MRTTDTPHPYIPATRSFGLAALILLGLLWQGLAMATPDIQHWETINGARVYYVAAPELPMLDVRVVFDAGSARDDGTPGLAMFTNSLLEEGAGSLDADAIAERFESLGARFTTDAARDMGIVSLRSLTRPELLQPSLELAAQVLSDPSFPPSAVERIRQQILISLRYDDQSPASIASKAYFRALYGDHPYAHPADGTFDSIQAITREQLIDFYLRYYVANNAVIAIVGDVSRNQAEAIAEQLIGHLPSGSPAPSLPAAPQRGSAQHEHIDFPSTQTHILVGQAGLARGDPDYFPLYVGNHILGGSGLVSRITDEVREKRGLAYSAYSYFSPMRIAGPFTLGLQTKNDSAEEALTVLLDTLQRFIGEGPSADEIDAAKKNITGGFPLDIDANSEIVSYLGMIGFYDLPLDYLDTFIAHIEAVTLEQVEDAFRRRIHPARLLTVTVGAGRE